MVEGQPGHALLQSMSSSAAETTQAGWCGEEGGGAMTVPNFPTQFNQSAVYDPGAHSLASGIANVLAPMQTPDPAL